MQVCTNPCQLKIHLFTYSTYSEIPYMAGLLTYLPIQFNLFFLCQFIRQATSFVLTSVLLVQYSIVQYIHITRCHHPRRTHPCYYLPCLAWPCPHRLGCPNQGQCPPLSHPPKNPLIDFDFLTYLSHFHRSMNKLCPNWMELYPV